MTIMDFVRKIGESRKLKSEKFKKMEEDYRLQKMLEDRQKSSTERELEKIYNKKREERLKQELDKIRHQENREHWTNNSVLKGSKNIMKHENRILDSGSSILKQKNLFKANKKHSCNYLK